MLTGIFVNPDDVNDIRRAIDRLHQWEASLTGTDIQATALREILNMDAARLVKLAYELFGTDQFTLPQLADQAGENVRVLHGMTGPLGRACDGRGVEVFNRHGGQPQNLSVRREVANILASEATTTAPA